MNTTRTVCVFPDTMPRAEILFPLVQVFTQVVYLRAVENDVPADDELSSLCREMIEQQLVRFVSPAPLGEHRERFLQLVHELQHRPDDYAGQLSQLSLAGLGSKKSESKTSIIDNLLKQSGIESTRQEQLERILWQASLVLKLGDYFDHEQEELQKNLDRITALEQGLIEELREEREQPFSLTRTLNAAAGRTDNQLRLRLKAWSRLFALGSDLTEPTTFITTSRDGLELLLEQFAQENRSTPQPLIRLQLPGGRRTDTFTRQWQKFREESTSLQTQLVELFRQPATVDEQTKKLWAGADSPWDSLLEKHYPRATNGRCTLTLYHLAAVNPKALFLNTFGQDVDGLQVSEDGGGLDLLVGLLEEQETA